jgi:hypothetical protein
VLLVRVICSGRDCLEEIEAVVGDLEEVEAIAACECGHGWLVTAVAEVELV